MKILSIDQAANLSGWSYWENNKPVKWGTIEPSPKSLKSGERLDCLHQKFSSLIDELCPDLIVIEDPVGGQEDKGGPENNWKTMQVLCQVQGMLMQLISSKQKQLEIISPSSWQYTCGIHKRNRAERKSGARDFVKQTYKIDDVIQDICDSICIAHHYIELQKKEVSAF